MNRVTSRLALLGLVAALVLPKSGFGAEKDPTVHDEMQMMGRAMRQLSHQYTDAAQKASSVELVDNIIQDVQKARTLTPPQAGNLKGDELAKFLDTYHKDLDALLAELNTLKDAISTGKNDVAKTEIEKIGQLKNSSHKELGVGGGNKRAPAPPAAP